MLKNRWSLCLISWSIASFMCFLSLLIGCEKNTSQPDLSLSREIQYSKFVITHIPETTVNIQIHKIDEQKYAIPLEIADEIGDFKDGDNLTIRIQLLKLERNSKIIAEYDMMSNEMVQELPIPSPLVKEIP